MRKNFKQNFDLCWRENHFVLKVEHENVKCEIITFIESKLDNYEVIKKGEIEKIPHFTELPCSLDTALSCDFDIKESFKAYIWSLIRSGEIDVNCWDSFDDIVGNEISYLSSNDD